MTPRQHQAEGELRRRARELLVQIEDFAIGFRELRAALLGEPGVRLLATRTRRRGTFRRLDLIAYRRPGGPRRASYLLVEWGADAAGGWNYSPCFTLAEARLLFSTWLCVPSWHRVPLLLEENDRAAAPQKT